MAQGANIQSNVLERTGRIFVNLWQSALAFIFLMVFIRAVKYISAAIFYDLNPKSVLPFLWWTLLDLQWILYVTGFILIVGVLIGFLYFSLMKVLVNSFLSLFIVIELLLTYYFIQEKSPLGVELFSFSGEDFWRFSERSNFVLYPVAIFVFCFLFFLITSGKHIPIRLKTSIKLSFLLYFSLLIFHFQPVPLRSGESETANNFILNKSLFFYTDAYNHFSTGSHIDFDFYLPEEETNENGK
jgi:hypothetical protein